MTSVQPTKRRPGRVGFPVGALLIVAAIAVFVIGLVVGLARVGDVVDGYQRTSADGGTLTFDQAGTYTVYFERPGIDDTSFGTPAVSFESSEGRPLALRSAGSGSVTYSFGGHDGRRIGKIDVVQPGTYTVRSVAGDSGMVAVGTKDPTDSFLLIGLGVVGAIILGIAGVATLIVTGVRRSRSGRTGGYPGAPGPGGWGAPPGQWGGPAGGPPGGWAPAPVAAPGAMPGWAPPTPGAPPAGAPGWAPPGAPPQPPAPGGWPPAPGPGPQGSGS